MLECLASLLTVTDAEVAMPQSVLPGTEWWGAFRLTPKQPSSSRPYGGIEAACPFHRASARTGCKKYMALLSDSLIERANVIRCLQSWCISAHMYHTQRDHMMHAVPSRNAPPSEALLAAGFILNKPSKPPMTDLEQDAEAAAQQNNETGAVESGHKHGFSTLVVFRGTRDFSIGLFFS